MQPKMSHLVYKIDSSIPPCAFVKPGELFTVELKNAFGKSFQSIEEFESFMAPENEEEKKRLNHPCTGPIEIITDKKIFLLQYILWNARRHVGTNAFQGLLDCLKMSFKTVNVLYIPSMKILRSNFIMETSDYTDLQK